jgi:hypothetical protein
MTIFGSLAMMRCVMGIEVMSGSRGEKWQVLDVGLMGSGGRGRGNEWWG